MTIENMQALVNSTLKNAGVDCSAPVSINNRLSNALGRAQCKVDFVNKVTYGYKIEISGLLARTNDDDEIRQTVLHECAHVIDYFRHPMGEHGHGVTFKRICAEIGCEEPGAHHSHRVELDWKYIIECPNCHHTTGFARTRDVVKHPECYGCTLCGHVGLKVIKG